jgi:hypothetical protein
VGSAVVPPRLVDEPGEFTAVVAFELDEHYDVPISLLWFGRFAAPVVMWR